MTQGFQIRGLRIAAAAWVCGAILGGFGHANPASEVVLVAAWDSAYISEGRDNLEDGGLFSGAIQTSWRGIGFSGWAARGDSVDYREYNIGLGYTFSLRTVGISMGYTRLEFDGVGESPGDNELALGISVPIPGEIELAFGGRYSTEADGAFLEAIVRRPCKLGTAGCVVTPYVMYGADHGYATAGHDGANHVEGGLALEYPIGQATVSVYCAHCWAQRDVHLDGGGDLTWGGVSVAMGF